MVILETRVVGVRAVTLEDNRNNRSVVGIGIRVVGEDGINGRGDDGSQDDGHADGMTMSPR